MAAKSSGNKIQILLRRNKTTTIRCGSRGTGKETKKGAQWRMGALGFVEDSHGGVENRTSKGYKKEN